MNKIKRDTFLKMSALAALAPFGNSIFASLNTGTFFSPVDDLLKRLITANDKQVPGLLETIRSDNSNFTRKIGYDFATLSASYVSPGSAYYHSLEIIPKLEIITAVLALQQSEDGTVNIGNLESPPDTAFLVELLTAAGLILQKDNSGELTKVNAGLKKFLLNAGNALSTGGVHTPNHRWVISAALAGLNNLYPNKKYVDRIEAWLGEGIYIDNDGHLPERSGIYSGVETRAFITIGRLLNKPALFNPVRKNLEMTYYYMEPNGDLVTNDSRRQDQYMTVNILPFYWQYRYMAIKDKSSKFAGITRLIENLPGFEKEVLDRGLFHFLEDSLLQQDLPASVSPADKYEKLFTTSHLLRIRREKTTATLFGGVDWPLTIASGRSNSPNFFSYRKGNAILKYMRLSSDFFSMGYFYSEGIKKEGNKYTLHKKLEVPYYQPLPKNARNTKGDYKLSPSIDNRFWNKMDFQKRPVSNVKNLETTITLIETNGAIELDILVSGLGAVPVTIELCFSENGTLSGVTPEGNKNNFLEKGEGIFESGGDTIRFGPGTQAHKKITTLEGERYSTHFGSLRTEGQYVYLTGITPFTHKLRFS